jgi:hypothetical protein
VQVGTIQISVPSWWYVNDPYRVCGRNARGGAVFAFEAAILGASECDFPPNVIAITNAPPGPVPHARSVVRNGIPTQSGYSDDGSARVRIVRALGMQIRISGPQTDKILRTMTHSPRSVVLNSEVDSVPRGWRQVTFGRLRFAVPGNWEVRHRSEWGGCSPNIMPNVLELNTAVTPNVRLCSFPETDARSLSAQPGMVLGAGPMVEPLQAPNACRQRAGLRICIFRQPTVDRGNTKRALSLLTARISASGWPHPYRLEIGLTGSGLTPLRIFDSIRPANQWVTGVN